MSSDKDPVLVSEADEDGVVLVTLNRPGTLNAANEELHGAVARVWDQAAAVDGAKAIVLTGAGRAFLALGLVAGDAVLRRGALPGEPEGHAVQALDQHRISRTDLRLLPRLRQL